jgi:hypothetical protein
MIRLIPFIYNSEIAYEIEFGDLYARFFYNKATLVNVDGDEVVIATPYLEEDLAALQFEQIADVMWLVHKDYAPRKLTRTTAYTFSLDTIVFDKGPFRIRNDILNNDDVTMTADVTTVGSTGTLVASVATFVDGHIGALFGLEYPKDTTIVSLDANDDSTIMDVKGIFSFVTRNTWTGTATLYRNVLGGSTATTDPGWDVFRTWRSKDDNNIQYKKTEYEDNVQYYFKMDTSSGTVAAELSVYDHTQVGVVRIDSVPYSNVANITVMTALPVVNGLVATYEWSEGAWSPLRGYPCSVTFFEERCIYVGNNNVWFSETGDFEDFEVGTKDADSFSLEIPSTNSIVWVKSIDEILVGTTGDEWSIRSNKLGTPITPTNYLVLSETTIGSSPLQPVKVHNVLLFVDFVRRKIREFTMGDSGKFVAPDMTALAEHITDSGITWIAFQKNPDEILWCGLTDGSLLSMTYERENNVVAWAKHPTDGNVQWGSVIPGADEDEVWISVERDVNGVDMVLIEVFEPRKFATISDCHFVDSGVFYDGTAATVITVGDQLIGETVHILADGVVVTPQVVDSNGQITLATAASKVHAGRPFTPKLEPMRPDIATATGTTHSSLIKVPEMGISFLNTMNATYGVTDAKQFDINWTDARWANNTSITGLYTGDIIVAIDGGFSLDNNLIVSSSSPLPITVRCLVPKIERTSR